jgi:hypothetical protein
MRRSVKIALAGSITLTGRGTLRATGTVSHGVDAIISRPVVKDLIKTRRLEVVFHEPHEDAQGWFVQLMSPEGEELGAAYGEDAADACLAAALVMERTIRGEGEDLEEPTP